MANDRLFTPAGPPFRPLAEVIPAWRDPFHAIAESIVEDVLVGITDLPPIFGKYAATSRFQSMRPDVIKIHQQDARIEVVTRLFLGRKLFCQQ